MEGVTQLKETKKTQYEELARLRMARRSFADCAEQMGVSVRTLIRWSQSSEFQGYVKELRRQWREEAGFWRVEEMFKEALDTMHELMSDRTVRPYVRLQAAAQIGNWVMLMRETEGEQDDREEFGRMQQLLEERQREINVTVTVKDEREPEKPLEPSVDAEFKVLPAPTGAEGHVVSEGQ